MSAHALGCPPAAANSSGCTSSNWGLDGACAITISITIGSRITSTLDGHASGRQPRAHAIAKIPLQLDGAVRDSAAGSARAFQILTEFLQKRRVVRQVVDNCHRLPAAA